MNFREDNKKNTELYKEKSYKNKENTGLNWENWGSWGSWGSWRNWRTGNYRECRGLSWLRRLRKAGSVVIALAMAITSVVGGTGNGMVAKAAVVETSTDVDADIYACGDVYDDVYDDVYEWTEDCVQVGGNGDTCEDTSEDAYEDAYEDTHYSPASTSTPTPTSSSTKKNNFKIQSYNPEDAYYTTEEGIDIVSVTYHSSDEPDVAEDMTGLEYLDIRGKEGRYRYNQLNDVQKKLYRFFKKYFDIFNSCSYDSFAVSEEDDKAVTVFTADLRARTYTADDIKEVIYSIRLDYPEYFWYDYLSYCPDTQGDIRYVSSFNVYCKPEFKDKGKRRKVMEKVNSGIKGMVEEIDREIGKEIGKNAGEVIRDSQNNYDKSTIELRIHDKICEKCRYSRGEDGKPNPSIEAHSIIGVFTDGNVVCEGYARAFQLLLYRYGIYNIYVCGDTQDGNYHAWNQVSINGEWLNVDVTWDDGLADKDGKDVWDYKYYNKNDEFFRKTHIYRKEELDEFLPQACNSTKDYGRKVVLEDVDLGFLEIKYDDREINYRGLAGITVKYKTKNPLKDCWLYAKKGDNLFLYSLSKHDTKFIFLDDVTEPVFFYVCRGNKKCSTILEKASVKVGKTTKVLVFSKEQNPKVVYSSKNPKVATVSKSGVVRGKRKGTTYICAKIGGKVLRNKVVVR